MSEHYLFPERFISERDLPSSVKEYKPEKNQIDSKTLIKHLLLFVLTFVCISFVGILWVGQSANAESLFDMLPEGILFATLLITFLTVHEFGHYFAAVYHNVEVSLPYFIPVPFGIGTMGAVIRIKERVQHTKSLFDIGVSGPVAGFIASLIILIYGFATLPDPTFIENFEGHEAVVAHIHETGTYPPEPIVTDDNALIMILGNTLLYDFIAGFFDNSPPMYEMYHFPFLFAGWLGLFFTALNLMPVGQLDGGHILYSLIGYRKHRLMARICFGGITLLAGLEAIPTLYSMIISYNDSFGFLSVALWGVILLFLMRRAFHDDVNWILPVWAISLFGSILWLLISQGAIYPEGTSGSLIWVIWSFFIVYFVGLEHPPVLYEEPLSPGRKALGWSSMAIFVLCISPMPIYFLQ
ncbi:MAG: site-2 protease family protein [Balneolaceae bacterium]